LRARALTDGAAETGARKPKNLDDENAILGYKLEGDEFVTGQEGLDNPE